MEESPNFAKHGKSFTNYQDVVCCNSWLAITHDPTVGNLQTSNTFWNKVLEDYKKNANDQSVKNVMP